MAQRDCAGPITQQIETILCYVGFFLLRLSDSLFSRFLLFHEPSEDTDDSNF